MKISSKTIFIFSPILIFLAASFIWYLILYQAVSFLSGFTFLIFLTFLIFWQNFLMFRRSGELIGLKNKKQIIIISSIFAMGLGELIWSISFLPFSFFILGGILAVIFGVVLDIYKEYFRHQINDPLIDSGSRTKSGDNLKIRKILIRDVAIGAIIITIFIYISPWLPPKIY